MHIDSEIRLGLQLSNSVFVIHDGEHEVTVDTDAADAAVVVSVLNLHTGDSFEVELGAAELRALLPPGFPAGAATAAGCCAFLRAAFVHEVDAGCSSAAAGAELTCVSSEEAGKEFVSEITRSSGSGFMAMSLTAKLTMPLKTQATPETKYQIGVRALRTDFQAEIKGLQKQLDLLKLQMNQRVFFGTTRCTSPARSW